MCVHAHLSIITVFWEICIVWIRIYKKQDKEKTMTPFFNFLKDVYSAVRRSRTRIVISAGRQAAVSRATGEHPYWPAREMSPHSRLDQLLRTDLGRERPAALNHFSSPSTHHRSLWLEAATQTKGMLTTKSVCMCVRTHAHSRSCYYERVLERC